MTIKNSTFNSIYPNTCHTYLLSICYYLPGIILRTTDMGIDKIQHGTGLHDFYNSTDIEQAILV